jgi:hypothetical protein
MNPQLKNLFTIPSVHAEPIDPGEMEELETFAENKIRKFRLSPISKGKETDMRITVNQLRRIIKEEVSRLSRQRLAENMAPGTSVKYSHPEFPGEMTGVIEFDAFEKSNVFIPDAPFHKRLLRLGYEPEAGLSLDGATVVPA